VPRTLTIGCTLPTSGAAADTSALRGLAQTAEAVGFDSIWLSDHVVVPERIAPSYPYSPDGRFPTTANQPYLEPLAALSYLAAATRQVRLGTHVLILPYRHPLLTAKMVATIDNLSGGRVDLGIGVGWILKTVWTQDVASFEGDFYSFERLGANPHPLQQPHPPIWVGGHSPAALRRTARYGDGWLPIGARPPADLPPEAIAAGVATIRAEAERVGRDPTQVRTCFSTTVTFDPPADAPARPFSGTPSEIAAELDRYIQVGVDSFIVSFGRQPTDLEQCLRRFAEQVRPLIGGGVAVG
jgi:alkanesulfonate monooxygenase SsuD/methylene tetrahydromethanopterin reductase-like flavin-dependent oxidoreductase (luciferase family)